MKIFIYSQRPSTLPQDKKFYPANNDKNISEKNHYLEKHHQATSTEKEKISQRHLDKIKEICEDIKVKLKTSGKKRTNENTSIKKSTSLTPIKSMYNGSQSSNAHSQAITNVPAVHVNMNNIEVTKSKVENLNEGLKTTTTKK